MSFISCSIAPDGYREQLTQGTWNNTELNIIGNTTNRVVFTGTFSTDSVFTLVINNPVTGTTTQQFFYTTGYYPPKQAIILYEYNEGNIGAFPPVVGTPIFYYFQNNFSQLVTSTNANMAFQKVWAR